MTDEEFYSTLDALCDHTKVRRQESLTAADVDQFTMWDLTFHHLDMIQFQRESANSKRGKSEGRT